MQIENKKQYRCSILQLSKNLFIKYLNVCCKFHHKICLEKNLHHGSTFQQKNYLEKSVNHCVTLHHNIGLERKSKSLFNLTTQIGSIFYSTVIVNALLNWWNLALNFLLSALQLNKHADKTSIKSHQNTQLKIIYF